MSEDSSWKKFLLKSGLPFEYEVKECFARQGCTVWDEYSYLREDEHNQEKEFSFDIDANYWVGGNSVNFLIECKYKTEPTQWVFTPDPYSYQEEIDQNSFLHPVDYFADKKFLFSGNPYCRVKEKLGEFCLKGVELFKNQSLETNIFKAINQLSYAFVDKVVSSCESQLGDGALQGVTFFNIPIIVTNAELRLINKDFTTKDIEQASSIEEITSKHNFLFFHNKIGEGLRKHNLLNLYDFFTEIGEERFKEKNNSFANDLKHFIDVIASFYCPQIILIMHHDEGHLNYSKLFEYITFHMKDSVELSNRIKEVSNEENEKKIKFDNMIMNKKKRS